MHELQTTTIGGAPITIRKRRDERLSVNGRPIVAVSTLSVGVALMYQGGGVTIAADAYRQAVRLDPNDPSEAEDSPAGMPQLPLPETLGQLLVMTDRAVLLELVIAAYAAWETHYEGGYLYTDDPTAVALFDAAREQYRAWREAKVEEAVASERQLCDSDQLWQRLRSLAADATYAEAVLLKTAHGLHVDDTTALAWLSEQRTFTAECAALFGETDET
jgi:hypothetical protein